METPAIVLAAPKHMTSSITLAALDWDIWQPIVRPAAIGMNGNGPQKYYTMFRKIIYERSQLDSLGVG